MSERLLCRTLSRLKDHEPTVTLGCTLPGAIMDLPFTPFVKARIRGREASLPPRRLLESVAICIRQPSDNNNGGWRLIN